MRNDTVTVKIEEQPNGCYLIAATSELTGETWKVVGRSLDLAGYVVQAANIGEMIAPEWDYRKGLRAYVFGYWNESDTDLLIRFSRVESCIQRFYDAEREDDKRSADWWIDHAVFLASIK